MSELLTVPEVAQILDLTRQRVYQLMSESPPLPVVEVEGRKRIRKADLQEWLPQTYRLGDRYPRNRDRIRAWLGAQ